MAEKTSGLYRLITLPRVYDFVQRGLGATRSRIRFKEQFFPNLKNKRILEVGCGPGTWFPEMSECREYLGVDWNADHISHANERHGGESVSFICGDVSKDIPAGATAYDFIFAFGIIHHLDDEQANSLLQACSTLLAADGVFISVDPVYHTGQHFFARWMCDRDSGQNIRSESEYATLTKKTFKQVETVISTDKLRIPYSHCTVLAR